VRLAASGRWCLLPLFSPTCRLQGPARLGRFTWRWCWWPHCWAPRRIGSSGKRLAAYGALGRWRCRNGTGEWPLPLARLEGDRPGRAGWLAALLALAGGQFGGGCRPLAGGLDAARAWASAIADYGYALSSSLDSGQQSVRLLLKLEGGALQIDPESLRKRRIVVGGNPGCQPRISHWLCSSNRYPGAGRRLVPDTACEPAGRNVVGAAPGEALPRPARLLQIKRDRSLLSMHTLMH